MSKRYRIVVMPSASNEIEAITQFVADGSPVNAKRLNQNLVEAIESLDFMPGRCPLVRELEQFGARGLAWRQIIVGPYKVVFRVHGDMVYVLSVYDGRRNSYQIIKDLLSKHSANDG